MQLAFERSGRGWIALFGLCLWLCACSDHDPVKSDSKDGGDEGDASMSDEGGRGGRGGSGGRGGTGGRAGASAGRGGAGGAGGGGGAPVDVDPSAYMCQPKPGDVGGPAESGADCCEGLGSCGQGGDETLGLPHDSCNAQPDLRCVPKPPSGDEDAGAPGSTSCRVQFPGAPPSAASFEGRCWPGCFVKSSPIASRLSRASCGEGELCAPCYDPLTGRSTGACEHGGDSPVEPPLPGFADCSQGAGYCVPAFAAGSAASSLQQLTCAAGELCAPKVKVADPSACFVRCLSEVFGPGACAPAFLAGPAAGLLTAAGCGMGELCVPCEALNSRTGVCD